MAKSKGGARPGAGRKPIAEEQKTRQLAQSAIINVYGSLENGLEKLLESKSDRLKLFVVEHAYGKAVDKVDLGGGLEIVLTRKVVK